MDHATIATLRLALEGIATAGLRVANDTTATPLERDSARIRHVAATAIVEAMDRIGTDSGAHPLACAILAGALNGCQCIRNEYASDRIGHYRAR